MPREHSTNQDLSKVCVCPWSKGAELFQPTQMAPLPIMVIPWGGLNHSRGGCSPDFGVCMNSKFYSVNSGKGEVFGTQTLHRNFLKKGWYWRQIRFTASKLNFCGFLYLEVVPLVLNLKEFFFFLLFSFLCCWICKAAALTLCILQFSLWRNNDLSVSYICVTACLCTQTVRHLGIIRFYLIFLSKLSYSHTLILSQLINIMWGVFFKLCAFLDFLFRKQKGSISKVKL